MTQPNQYVHGYDPREQDRLIAQADHWREMIVSSTPVKPGDHFLEIGCGAGAVLGVIGQACPQAKLAGIDIEARQIDRARQHLESLHLAADLRTGNAAALPWKDGAFDHVFFMWMLEHLTDQDPVLTEARRVLKPGGCVHVTETDYNFVTFPPNADFAFLMDAWRKHFVGKGDALLARRLGSTLLRNGFREPRIHFSGFHAFRGQPNDALPRMAHYHADYIEPEIESIAAEQLINLSKLQRGVQWMRELVNQPDASISGTVYRATATA